MLVVKINIRAPFSGEGRVGDGSTNPAKNTVYLNWRLPEEMNAEQVRLLVYNTQGVQLRSENLNGQVGIQEINISNWASGLYIYQLRHEEILLHSEKFEVLR